MRRRQRGYTLVEMIVSLSVFGMLVAIFAILASEMRSHQRRYPVNFMKHPQISAVLSRMRRDVQDAYVPNVDSVPEIDPYFSEYDGFENGPRTLILQSRQPAGGIETIVWDCSKPGEILRRSYNVGVKTDWMARGLPAEFSLTIGAVDFGPNRAYGVRVMATDAEGRLAVDQILQPRTRR